MLSSALCLYTAPLDEPLHPHPRSPPIHLLLLRPASRRDFNGDGLTDMVLAVDYNPVFLNNGIGANPIFTQVTGALVCERAVLTDSASNTVCADSVVHLGDLDGDGDIDVIFQVCYLLMSFPAHAFSHLPLSSFFSPHDVIPQRVGRRSEVHLNNGLGVFTSSQEGAFTSQTTAMLGMALADTDGDSDLEVIQLLEGNNVKVYATEYCARSGAFGNTGTCYTCPTFSSRHPISDKCVECSPNHERGASGTCASCPAGQERPAGALMCADCRPGTATLGSGASCVPCLPGAMAAGNGTSACSLCPRGKFVSMGGGSMCEECPIGSFCREGASAPELCPAGRFGDTPGRGDDLCSGQCATGHYCPVGSRNSTTVKCPPGTYSPALGATSAVDCMDCDQDAYCPIGTTTPIGCDLNKVTLSIGVALLEDCVCDAQYYGVSTPNGTTDCRACVPDKVDCAAPGSSLYQLAVRPTYWRRFNYSLVEEVEVCFNPDACVPLVVAPAVLENATANATDLGTSVNATTANATSRRRLSVASLSPSMVTYGDALCTDGHTGPFCSNCVSGYFGGSDIKLCQACEGDVGMAFMPLIMLLLVLAILLIFFIRGGRGSLASTSDAARTLTTSITSDNVSGAVTGLVRETTRALASDKYDAAVEQSKDELNAGAPAASVNGTKARLLVWSATVKRLWGKFQVKLKILISLFQVLNGMGFAFSIPYPPLYQSTIGAVASIIEVDLPSVMPLDCIFPMDYFSKLVLRTVAPLVVYAVMYVAAKVFRRMQKPWQADALIDGIFFIAFLIYPSTTSKLFSMFVCKTLEGGDGYLRVDFSLQCMTSDGWPTPGYVGQLVFTFVMIVVHTCGTPLAYAYLLFVKFRPELEQLQAQELADYHKERLAQNSHLKEDEKELLQPLGTNDRVDKSVLLPGYMRKLTGGCKRTRNL